MYRLILCVFNLTAHFIRFLLVHLQQNLRQCVWCYGMNNNRTVLHWQLNESVRVRKTGTRQRTQMHFCLIFKSEILLPTWFIYCDCDKVVFSLH